MRQIKGAYSAVVRGVARSGWLDAQFEAGVNSDCRGWRRWAASLLAIHDVERMIALDIPWWNVAATEEVASFLAEKGSARVFEYGSGASTAWLAKRSAHVTAVEHDKGWHDVIERLLSPCGNVTLLYRDVERPEYVEAIAAVGGLFDLVVIDGRRRSECLRAALPHLAPGGLILFDDTGRKRYAAEIANCGLSSKRHFGRSYCVPYPDFSTVIYG